MGKWNRLGLMWCFVGEWKCCRPAGSDFRGLGHSELLWFEFWVVSQGKKWEFVTMIEVSVLEKSPPSEAN